MTDPTKPAEPTILDRNPLALKSAAIAAVTAIVSLLGLFFDSITPEVSVAIVTTAAAVLGMAVAMVRSDVTPMIDPRDYNGNPLIEVDPEEYDDFLDNELLIEVEDEESEAMGFQRDDQQG